jgi:two-component system, sensor histidine kinase PdtaS
MKNIYFLLLFSVQFVCGQQTINDSLLQLLAKEKVDTLKLNLLDQLAKNAVGIDIRKALEYAKQGVQLAESTGNKNWQPRFYETAGRMHANLSQLDSANSCYDKAMAVYVATNNKRGQAGIFYKYAYVFRSKGDVEKALAADLRSLRIMEELDDKEGIARAYEFVSDDLTRQGRLTEAMDYAKKSIEVSEKYNIRDELAYALFNAGNVSINMENNQQALEYYNKSLDMARSLHFAPSTMASFTNGRGNARKRLAQYQLALEDYNNTLTIAKQSNFTMGIASAIANLGEVNMLMGNYKEALGYQLETVRLQEENGDLANLTENYRHVSTIYEKLGDYKQALIYQRKAGRMRDSVASIKSDTAMSRLLTQYQSEKKEATIAAQKSQISQQKKVQWLSIGVAVLLAGFLVFVYRSFRNRSKSNKLLAAKNAENELLLKEIHHRVKNNLEVVSSLLALQSAQIDDPNTREAMQEGQNRVHSIGIVHQKLYQGENLGAIEMKDYFINLSESILDTFGAEGRVNVECAMEKLNVDIDTAVPLGLIVNELLTNTLKYAFPNNQNGSVRIKLEKQTDGILHLEVSDNGIGKSGITHGTGFGGQLVSLLTRQLNGSMKEEIKNGTRISFDFRLDKVA